MMPIKKLKKKGNWMDVLLSIKPQYADAILNGLKLFEFRKSIFRQDIDLVYIYSTKHVGKIVGCFKVEDVITGSPTKLWKKSRGFAGINKVDYFNYFADRKKAYAIKIKKAKKFKTPIDPYEMHENFTPPQSFYYIDENFFRR